jgi:hypothetical protein
MRISLDVCTIRRLQAARRRNRCYGARNNALSGVSSCALRPLPCVLPGAFGGERFAGEGQLAIEHSPDRQRDGGIGLEKRIQKTGVPTGVHTHMLLGGPTGIEANKVR